jgi:excisionase family DNA binding protein
MEMLTVKELVKITKISRSTIYTLINKGIFPEGIKIGYQRRWLKEDVEGFLKGFN